MAKKIESIIKTDKNSGKSENQKKADQNIEKLRFSVKCKNTVVSSLIQSIVESFFSLSNTFPLDVEYVSVSYF